MNIFLIISSFDLGGAERVAINMAKSKNPDFNYHVFEVVKGDSHFSSSLKNECHKHHIAYHCSPLGHTKIAMCLFGAWFVWHYLTIKPQIIHLHTEKTDLALWIFRKIAWLFFWIRPKYVRTIHNTQLWNKWGKLGNMVERYYLKHHSNIAISTSTRECYVARFGGTPPPIVYNGLEEVKQLKFPDLKQGKTNILFAGRLEYQKGIDELIAVVTLLKDDNRFHFYIVGSGSMEEKMKSAFKGFTQVSLYQKIFDLSHYVGSFDYLFMPSNHEGLALMSIEASLAHTPTIINACPGLTDTLPRHWKLSVKENSIPHFVEIITNPLDSRLYHELAEEAYQFAIEHFSLEVMQKKYEKHYHELFGN